MRPKPLTRVFNSVAAGQNTAYFLVTPNDKYSDLPRHPIDIQTPEECVMCNQDRGESDSPLACDKVRQFLSMISVFFLLSLTYWI